MTAIVETAKVVGMAVVLLIVGFFMALDALILILLPLALLAYVLFGGMSQ